MGNPPEQGGSGRDPAEEVLAELLERYLDRAAALGEHALTEACAEHPEHLDALRERIASLRSAGLIGSAFRAWAPEPELPFFVLAPGKIVGDFRLVSLLGKGGMGQVWQAEQLSLGCRHVAVKFVLPERLTERRLEFFAREARAGGRLSHPGLVAVHAHGQTDGLAWIAMELVHGATSLRDFIDAAARAREIAEGYDRTVAALIAEAAEAMQAAHDVNVVHRDLKPQNVLLTTAGHCKVTDFGVARITDEKSLSRTGDMVGTYQYMSPEQVLGSEVDARSDIFSLGVVLYESLTLRRPFQGDTSHQIATQILTKEPPDPRLSRSRIPRDLVVITLKALEKDRARRYPSMHALAADLRCFLGNEPILAAPPTRLDRARKWVKRHPGRALALASAAAAFAAITLLLFQNVRTNRTLAALNLSLEERTREANQAAGRERQKNEEFGRLAALQDLDDLVTEAEALWPVTPDKEDRFVAWLERAGALVAELPSHEATLAKHRPLGATGAGAGVEPVFDSQEDRWWHNQMRKLVDGTRAFADERTGLFSAGISAQYGWGIRRRLAFAREIGERTLHGAEARRRWEEARASIRDPASSPWFGGLELTPQLGLLPIGRDENSGLWEFAHLESGAEAVRGEDGRLRITDQTGLVFVLVPGGTFAMGAQRSDPQVPNHYADAKPDESPVHTVRLSPFFLSKYEMTQGQWERVTGRNPSLAGPGARLPVERASWTACTRVCARLGLALPTEAQWEYAARAGTETPWWSGEDPTLLAEVANLADEYRRARGGWAAQYHEAWNDGSDETAIVGSYAPNPFGLHDVYGNVWEWCADWLDDYRDDGDTPLDPVRLEVKGSVDRVLRGGCYVNCAESARSAYRGANTPDDEYGTLGLRPARALSPVPAPETASAR